jgi:hypothetical protein
MAGYDTAGTVQGVWGSAVQGKFGNPAFWIRYFSPSNYRPVNYSSANANAECHVVWTSGAKHLGCVTTPSRLDGTYAAGQAAAGTFGSAMHQVWLWVVPLNLPTNDVLYCWLDQEPGYNLSTSFWNGWAERLDAWNFNSAGIYPYYPCLYCDPCNSTLNCSTLRNASYAAFAIWTPDPRQNAVILVQIHRHGRQRPALVAAAGVPLLQNCGSSTFSTPAARWTLMWTLEPRALIRRHTVSILVTIQDDVRRAGTGLRAVHGAPGTVE